MKRIGLVFNTTRKENISLAKKIENYLINSGLKVTTCKAGPKSTNWYTLRGKIDLVIMLGGDGTLLSTSRYLAPKKIPILGINTGHLGFLTEWRKGDVVDLVNQVLRKRFKIDKRGMLCTYIMGSKKIGPLYALNDVVVSRGQFRKMLQMTLNVDERPVADYIADGLIICTPTGSTAYALSSGGAVMEPGIGGIEIVPICAHTLASRPHIVSDKREITITFNKPFQGAILQIDGQESFQLKENSIVKITRSKYEAKLIKLYGKESDFYWRIRQKFHWGKPIQ